MPGAPSLVFPSFVLEMGGWRWAETCPAHRSHSSASYGADKSRVTIFYVFSFSGIQASPFRAPGMSGGQPSVMAVPPP